MKAALFRGLGCIEVTDVPPPQPGPGEVLVRVYYCGICGSDLEAYQTGMYQPGMIVGHEFSGEIVVVGEGVSGWKVGEHVIADNVLPCGQCWFCKQGRPILCQQMVTPGVTLDGAMAEYVRLPVALLYRVPAGVSSRQAALVEPLTIALQGVRSSALRAGDWALVLGAGPIGLLTLQCALAAGARQVFVVETNAKRAALAKEMGATAVFHPQRDNLAVEVAARTDGIGPAVVYVCTGAVPAFQDALNLVRRGGQIYVLGLCPEPVPVDFLSVVLGELDLRGGYMGHGTFPAALDYLAQGRVKVEQLVSHVINLDDVVTRGFAELLRPDTEAIKILVNIAGT